MLLSACEDGCKVELHLTNDLLQSVQGSVRWSLRRSDGSIVEKGECEASVDALSAKKVCSLEFKVLKEESARRTMYFEYSFDSPDGTQAAQALLFVPPKHYEAIRPNIAALFSDCGDCFEITLSAEHLAKYVECSLSGIDATFSDNFFDLIPDFPRTIKVKKRDLPGDMDAEMLNRFFVCRSVYDIV